MTTKFYGQSDDLLYAEGDFDEEFGVAFCPTQRALLVSDGTVLEYSYPKTKGLGVWGFKVLHAGPLFDRIEECDNENAEIYSDIVYFKDGVNNAYLIPYGAEECVLDLAQRYSPEELFKISPHEKLMRYLDSERY